MAGSFHIGRTGFHLQDRVAAAPRTYGMFVNMCPFGWSAAIERSCITSEIGTGLDRNDSDIGARHRGFVRPSSGIAKGSRFMAFRILPNGSNERIAPSRVLYTARVAAVGLPAPRSNE